jgi:hypothetical protein
MGNLVRWKSRMWILIVGSILRNGDWRASRGQRLLNWERIIQGIDTFCDVESMGDVNGCGGVGAKVNLVLRFGIILFEVDAINDYLSTPVRECIRTPLTTLSTITCSLRTPLFSGATTLSWVKRWKARTKQVSRPTLMPRDSSISSS